MDAFGLSLEDLYQMKETGRASEMYIRLARFEAHRARVHLERGRVHLHEILTIVPSENARALTTLIDTYGALLNNLDEHDFDVFAGSLELTEDQRARILAW
jgi:phytoene/squalene synthetase